MPSVFRVVVVLARESTVPSRLLDWVAPKLSRLELGPLISPPSAMACNAAEAACPA